MSGPTRVVKCMIKRLREHYSGASVYSWSFPSKEMKSEVKVVTEGNWEGELKGLLTTGAWIFLVVVCWRRVLRYSRLWLRLLRRVSTPRLQILWRSAVFSRSST